MHGFNQIGDDGAKSIASAVEGSSSLRWLGLVRRTLLVLFLLKLRFFWYRGALELTCAEQGFSQIGDDGVKSIAAAVEKNSSLRELHLV